MKTSEDNGKKFLKMEGTVRGHYGIALETRKNENTSLYLVEEN